MNIGERMPEAITGVNLWQKFPYGPIPATGYSLTGPTGGVAGSASTVFTVALTPPGGTVAGTVTVTPSDGGAGGTFAPASVGLTTAAPSATFTYTPSSAGAKTISVSDTGGLTDPTSLIYTATAAPGAILATWPDSSGKGHTATAVGSPKLVQSVLNGLPVVRFRSASSDGFNIAPIVNVRPSQVFAVMKVQAVGKLLYALGGDGAAGTPFDLINSDGKVLAANQTEYQANSGINLSPWHVILFWNYGSGYPVIMIDGTQLAYEAASPLAGTNWNTIGYNIIQGAFSDGDIAELAINYSEYNVNSQAIISYLGHKWGIVTTQDAVTPGYPSLYAENVAWWRADTLWIPPNLVDGDAVSQWPDSSGGGRHANGTGATRPILKTNVLGGRPVVRFSAAGSQKLTFAPSIPVPGDVTYFVVAKRTGATFASIGGNINSTYGPLNTDGVTLYSGSNLGFVPLSDTSVTTAFHVLTSDLQIGVFTAYYIDGTQFPSASSPYPNAGVLTTLGAHLDPITYMDGDIAEIIVYSGAVALRLKLTLLLVTLLVVMPAPGELEAMAGDRRKIKRYLRQHGAHATEEQLDAVVTPMAVGDRANIEKYLGTKYGITVAGGTAVDPATIPGMLGWWKADSLL